MTWGQIFITDINNNILNVKLLTGKIRGAVHIRKQNDNNILANITNITKINNSTYTLEVENNNTVKHGIYVIE